MGTIREKAFKMMKRLKDKVGYKRKDVDLDCSAEFVKAFGEESMHINYIDSLLYSLLYSLKYKRIISH